MRAAAQEYVGGVAAVESAAVVERGVAVLKQMRAFLRQIVFAAGRTCAAAVGNAPRNAIANAQVAYARFGELFAGPRWEKLAAQGARVQRPLWASTGTKNPDYSDVLYVEELIGPDTVNTLPEATFLAFRDHGTPRASLEEGLEEAAATMRRLADAGLSMERVTAELQEEAVRLFVEPFDQLLAAIEAQTTA